MKTFHDFSQEKNLLFFKVSSLSQDKKSAFFESDFCVSCASHVATLFKLDIGPFFHVKSHQNFTNVNVPLDMLFSKKFQFKIWKRPIKEIVQPKMKILSFVHNLYKLVFS